jgi:cytoskeletal protein CcmA (bactofilin family)
MNTLKSISLTACLILASLTVPPVWGGTFHSSDEDTSFFSVPVKGDLYVAGRKIVVDGTVEGDVVAAGGMLIINGDVEQDILAVGYSLIVNGQVGDDIRTAVRDCTIFSTVGGDLIVFGGSVTVARRATIEGDLIAAGGHVILDGTIKGDVKVAGGEVVLNGTVLGNSVFHAADRLDLNGEIRGKTTFTSNNVVLGSSASFGGDIEYWTRKGTLDFSDVDLSGEALFNPDLEPESKLPREIKFRRKHAAGFLGFWFLFTLLTGALTIFVFLLLPKRWYTLAVGSLREGFWRSFGLGLLYFILTPIIAFILMATLVGMPLGLFIFLLFMFSLAFSKAISAIVLARWIERKRFGQWGKAAMFFLSLLLFALLKLLTLVPVVGWVALLILISAVYGSILTAAWTSNRDAI